MFYELRRQIALCYLRAAECRDLAVRREVDREFYLDREKAWLRLAQSFELSERISRVINGNQRQRLGNWPVNVSALSMPNCPACDIAIVQVPGVTTDCAIFLCPNCRRLVEQLVEVGR
jgi:transposase-like protein